MGKTPGYDGGAEYKQAESHDVLHEFDPSPTQDYLSAVINTIPKALLAEEEKPGFVRTCVDVLRRIHAIIPTDYWAILPRVAQIIQDTLLITQLPEQLKAKMQVRINRVNQFEQANINIDVPVFPFSPAAYVEKKLMTLYWLMQHYAPLPQLVERENTLGAGAYSAVLQVVPEQGTVPFTYVTLALTLLSLDTVQAFE